RITSAPRYVAGFALGTPSMLQKTASRYGIQLAENVLPYCRMASPSVTRCSSNRSSTKRTATAAALAAAHKNATSAAAPSTVAVGKRGRWSRTNGLNSSPTDMPPFPTKMPVV
ncbi:unnamed protein product, partial [Ectocarpus sp. 12 AP-2014]